MREISAPAKHDAARQKAAASSAATLLLEPGITTRRPRINPS